MALELLETKTNFSTSQAGPLKKLTEKRKAKKSQLRLRLRLQLQIPILYSIYLQSQKVKGYSPSRSKLNRSHSPTMLYSGHFKETINLDNLNQVQYSTHLLIRVLLNPKFLVSTLLPLKKAVISSISNYNNC